MPMYWTFNCFFRLLIYLPPLPTFLQVTLKSWILTSEKKEPSCPNWGKWGGVWWFGQCPKENVFFSLMSSLSLYWEYLVVRINNLQSFVQTSAPQKYTLFPCGSVPIEDLDFNGKFIVWRTTSFFARKSIFPWTYCRYPSDINLIFLMGPKQAG